MLIDVQGEGSREGTFIAAPSPRGHTLVLPTGPRRESPADFTDPIPRQATDNMWLIYLRRNN